ncbi:MAG: DUF2817 domain-containing protein [Candidatus Melainabacteria bacterium]|nr:MAG: DUF2817 domain-containing protein [Candidatus Melainabacteria bacterium]
MKIIKFNETKYDKTVLILGVFHGDEQDGEFLIQKYIDSNPKITKNRIIFIPVVNETGKAQNTRVNKNGVDLNRNFPTSNWELSKNKDDYFGGEYKGSEEETQKLIKIIEHFKPDCILSLHQPYRCVNFGQPYNETYRIAQKISQINGYKIEENIGYPTPGSFGTYCGLELKIPTITLELPENEDKNTLWQDNKGIFEFFCK